MVTNGMESYLLGSPIPALATAFAGGFLASLSPCVYPMIPIVSVYVSSKGSNERSSRISSFQLSLGYVLGMALVYALLGMIAAWTGSMFGQISTSPWALLVVANTLIWLGLNMMEVLPLPALFAGRLTESSMGGMLGAFLVGAASGLVASPCVSPVLLGLLAFVATKHSLLYGGALLLSFSLGMGVLLLVVGTFSGLAASLPKPGPWMVSVKKLLGLSMLALAEFYLIKAGQVWF